MTTTYVVQFRASNERLAPELTGLPRTFELGAGYYVSRRTGIRSNYQFELVDGPYTPYEAQSIANAMNKEVNDDGEGK